MFGLECVFDWLFGMLNSVFLFCMWFISPEFRTELRLSPVDSGLSRGELDWNWFSK